MKVKGLGLERVLLKWVWSGKDIGKELLWRRVGNSPGTKHDPEQTTLATGHHFLLWNEGIAPWLQRFIYFFSALICKWRRSALFPKGWVFLPKVSMPSRDLAWPSPDNSLPATPSCTEQDGARCQSDWNHGVFILSSWPFFPLGESHGCLRSLRRFFRRLKPFQFQYYLLSKMYGQVQCFYICNLS